MNMTMLAEFLSDVMIPQHVALPETPDVTLSEDWIQFEETLGRYKQQYKEKLTEFGLKESEIVRMSGDISILQNASTVLSTQELREDVSHIVQDFKETCGFETLRDELSQLNGEIKAMEQILMNTNARKYSQFTCSICMERMVDTFLDPCGHLSCESCLGRTRSMSCPMCRTTIQAFKKMYPTMG
jgi:rubrerythrin